MLNMTGDGDEGKLGSILILTVQHILSFGLRLIVLVILSCELFNIFKNSFLDTITCS